MRSKYQSNVEVVVNKNKKTPPDDTDLGDIPMGVVFTGTIPDLFGESTGPFVIFLLPRPSPYQMAGGTGVLDLGGDSRSSKAIQMPEPDHYPFRYYPVKNFRAIDITISYDGVD